MNIIKRNRVLNKAVMPALALAISALSLSGCGNDISEGYWELSEATEGKKTVKSDELEEYGLDGSYIVTGKNGDGYAVFFDIPADFQTDEDKGVMTFATGKVDYKASGSKLTLEDSNITLVYKKSKDDAPPRPEDTDYALGGSVQSFEDDEDTAGDSRAGDVGKDDNDMSYSSPHEFFEGDWYGWWQLSARKKFWKDYDGEIYDVMCEVKMDDDTSGTMTLWDAGMPYDEPIARMPVTVSNKGYDPQIGSMQPDNGGQFLDGEVTESSWFADPGVYDWKNYMMIAGTYIDGDGDEAFDYVFHLKKWGDDWSDFSQKPPQFAWYQKQIKAGKPMPDTLPE